MYDEFCLFCVSREEATDLYHIEEEGRRQVPIQSARKGGNVAIKLNVHLEVLTPILCRHIH